MGSVMAIISKAVFEKTMRGMVPGEIPSLSSYRSTHRALEPLAEGGSLYLVTVRPKDTLWLVGVLRDPERDEKGWSAAPSVTPITDITRLKSKLRFASGKKLSTKKGALGMSLQTPRQLRAEDIALLEGATGGSSEDRPRADLVRAVDALGQGKPTLGLLLAAWRKTPSARLGAAIEYYAPDEDEVGEAIAGLAGQPSKELIKRVQGLAQLEPDPRVASALVDLVEKPPFTSQAMKKMWTSLFGQLVEHHVDPRSLARLRAVQLERTFGSTNMAAWMADRLAETIAQLEAHFAAGEPLLPDDEALEGLLPREEDQPARIEAAAGRKDRTGEQLLAEIAENLDDDAPRLVYADLVAEQGDAARAELINLQIQRAASGVPADPGEAKLVRKHAARWLAPIVPVLKKGAWTFERGFLDSCTIYPRKGKALELAGHPLWATVREVQLSETGDPAPIITHPVMRNLRTVVLWAYPRGLAGLLDSDAPVERLLGLFLPNARREPSLWHALIECKRLPRLRLVHCSGARPEDARELWSGGLARPGMKLVFAMYGHQVGPFWLELLGAGDDPAPAITLTTYNAEFHVDRKSRALTCTLAPDSVADGLWDVGLAFGLAGTGDGGSIGEGRLRRVALRVPEGGVTGELRITRPFETLVELQAALKDRCKRLGAELAIEEGRWEMVYEGPRRR
jgi:uncharacterized protein (TIGR02996 family)